MTEYQKQGRVDLAILDALTRCTDPITFRALCSHVCPHEHWVSDDAISQKLVYLIAQKFVVVSHHPRGGSVPMYSITQGGQVFLTASEATPSRAPFHAEHREEPLQVSFFHTEPEVPDAAQALLCVDEDELNDWWDALDVEAKADAFVQWSLSNDGRNSHVYIEPPATVPVTGKIGEDKERLQQRLSEIDSSDADIDLIKSLHKHAPKIAKALKNLERLNSQGSISATNLGGAK